MNRVITCSLSLLLFMNYAETATRPPSIIQQPSSIIYFKKGEARELPCVGEGIPKPTYLWKKNGQDLEVGVDDSTTLLAGVGTLMLTNPQTSDEGIYQCFAENAAGIALSSKIDVREAMLEIFQTVFEPERMRPILGYPLKLTCKPPNSEPEAVVKWGIIIPDSRETLQPVTLDNRVALDYVGNLYFANILPEDSNDGNRYVCLATNGYIRSQMQGEDKIIEPIGNNGPSLQPVNIMYHSSLKIIKLTGDRIYMKCIFSGFPTPTVTWEKVGGVLPARAKVESSGLELMIEAATLEDEGLYKCSGSNSVMQRPLSKQFSLIVQGRPQWSTPPINVEAGVEESATFLCNAYGIPEPVVQWFINGLSESEWDANPRRHFENNNMTYVNLTTADHQVIQCNATNKHGSIWADNYLNVLAESPIMIQPMNVEERVAEGQDISLSCKTGGKPTPKITWFKSDQILIGDRFPIDKDGSLHLTNVSKRDSGPYRCEAKNKFGIEKGNGVLSVRTKTQIVLPPPLSQQVIYRQTARLRCIATTDVDEKDHLKVKWLKNGKLINLNNKRIKMEADNTLVITNAQVTDSAQYTCNATNELDYALANANITVKVPPDPPENVTLSYCKGKKAIITWDKGRLNNKDTNGFIIEYQTAFSDEWFHGMRVGAKRRQATMMLSAWATYIFRARAENQIGISEPSVKLTGICVTPVTRPDKHPDNPGTVGDKRGHLVIEWQPMPQIEHNGPNFHYTIIVKNLKTNKEQLIVVEDYTLGKKEIAVDAFYEPFNITVFAENEKGRSLKQAKTFRGFSGEDTPTVVPQNFEVDPNVPVSAHSAAFRWEKVDQSLESVRGKFHGYRIEFWKKGEKETSLDRMDILSSTVSSRRKRQVELERAVVTNLPAFSDLIAHARVINTYYAGPPSNAIELTTPESVPGKVSFFRAVVRGSNHFLLEWGEPMEKNGHLTGYDIAYQEVVGHDLATVVDRDPQIDDPMTTRAVLSGLKENMIYRIRIWAKTQVGRGTKYFIDVKTTDSGPPDPPELIFGLVGVDFANITWKNSSPGGRAGVVHYVEYRKKGSSKWLRTPNVTLLHWQNLTDLNSGTTYDVRVIAINQVDTTSSRVRDFTTMSAAAAVGDIAKAAWFIAMMVVIAIFILILIVVCIIKRNRGDKYHVQEKERLRGRDLDGQDQDNFHDYSKNGDENGLTKNRSSFDNSLEKAAPESDTDSMAEYGESMDPTKFNEDGSFIGQYGGNKREPSEVAAPSAMSTFV